MSRCLVADHEGVEEGRTRLALGRLHNLVDEAVLDGLLGAQVLRAGSIRHDLLRGLAGGRSDELAGHLAVREDLTGLDGNVRRLATRHGARLVQHDGRVRERAALALLALGEQHGSSAEGLAHAHSVDGRADVVDGVRDGKGLGLEAGHAAIRRHRTRGVDVKSDGPARVLVIEVQQLRDDELRHSRHKGHTDVHDAVVQKQRRQVRRGTHARTCGGKDSEEGEAS
mmetsp:Transcript_8699/g.25404  ORF Transcript_8699/g.25404 Transcript_8699/m.25404 type:complete len:226 (+) Transcript_8699:290-967(+)